MAVVPVIYELYRFLKEKYPPEKYPYLYGVMAIPETIKWTEQKVKLLKERWQEHHPSHSPYAVKLIEEEMNGKTKQTFVTFGIPTKEEAIAVAYSLEDYPPMKDVVVIDQMGGRTVWQYSIDAPLDKNKRYAVCHAYYFYFFEPEYDIKGVYYTNNLEKAISVGKRLAERPGDKNFLIVDRTTRKVLYSFSDVPIEEYEMWGNFYV
jgi:hypothetical protein